MPAITSADFNGDGVRELVICSQLDDTGGADKGAVWILSVEGCREFIPITVDTTFCPGDSIPLTVGGSLTYQWSPAASLDCATCQSPIARPTSTTTYQVIVADTLGCIDTLSVTITMDTCMVGIEDNLKSGLSISPNPLTSDQLTLSFDEKPKGALTIRLFDALGRQVLSQVTAVSPQEVTFRTGDIPSGIYFLVVEGQNGTYSQKLLKN